MTPGGTPAAAGAGATGPDVSVPLSDVAGGPDDQALDDFFDDNDELADDRRFGGRLRRRR
jgi:hypothetical protein